MTDADRILTLLARREQTVEKRVTVGVLAAGILDWPGNSVQVEHRVANALHALESLGLVKHGWSEREREYFWWLEK